MFHPVIISMCVKKLLTEKKNLDFFPIIRYLQIQRDRITTLIQAAIDYIKSKLLTITGIEHVFQCLPFIKDDKQLFEKYSSTINAQDVLQAWEVSNISSEELIANVGNVIAWNHTIHLQGFFSFNYDDPDASAAQMQVWVDAIKRLFLKDSRLGHTVNSRASLRHILSQPEIFMNRLCHRCVFELVVTTQHALS